MRNSKTLAMLSIVVAAAVLGIFILSASASENATPAEGDTASTFSARAKFRNRWLDSLTDEQRDELRVTIEANRAEVQELLATFGIEVPECRGPMGLRGSLTDEQRDELRTMRQDFRDSVKAKLEEWGVDAPPCQGGMRFRGRHPGGFGLFKP